MKAVNLVMTKMGTMNDGGLRSISIVTVRIIRLSIQRFSKIMQSRSGLDLFQDNHQRLHVHETHFAQNY
jgi:hypothetical protein